MDEERTGWRPIETAPRDGKPVLFWYEGSQYESRGHKIGCLSPFNGRWVPRINCTIFSTSWEAFTHWQPLPEPPND